MYGRIDYDITEALDRAEGRRFRLHITLPTKEEMGYIFLLVAVAIPLVASLFD